MIVFVNKNIASQMHGNDMFDGFYGNVIVSFKDVAYCVALKQQHIRKWFSSDEKKKKNIVTSLFAMENATICSINLISTAC